MDKQIKAIIMKETRESIQDRKLVLSIIINILIFTVIGFSIDYFLAPGNSFVAIIIIILYPVFSMWILSFPFIQEKFWNVKLVNGFQPLLTLPITLRKIWLGKIAAIFLLSYPSTVTVAIILTLAYYLSLSINPLLTIPITLWIWIFVLGPLLIMVYNLIASWIALKFNNPRVMDILQYTSITLFIFAFVGAGKINQLIVDLHFNDWTLMLFGIFIIGLFTSLTYNLISNLKKEAVIS